MSNATLLISLTILPFAGSLVAAFLPANARNIEAWLSGLIALSALILTTACYWSVTAGGVMRYEAQWLPTLGLNFILRMDGFAWLFAMLVTGIGLLVVLYARYYMSPQDPVPRFFSFFLAFMGAMLGVVLAGNLIQLVFFWELTGLFSFLLIGYWHHRAGARDGARMALTVTATGGLCLLAGMLILGHVVGSYDLDEVLAAGELIRSHALYLPALILILLGALTKSAQFPFHFWLPQAMVAPTPVSAYLHSATLVKAGVFLLARLWPALAGTDAWLWIVGMSGLVTFVLGAYLAIFQQDLKGLLAYSTISHLGLITLLLGLNTPLAAVAGIFHIINHATFKASLFMGAGIIDHETGTRDIRRLSGLYRFMPITATLAMVAAAAMAGVPLLNGFLSKEMFFAETIAAHDGSLVDQTLPLVATLAGMFSVAYSLRFIHETFFGPPAVALPRVPHEPPRWMRFPVELLVVACLVVGIIPELTVGPVLETAAYAVLGPALPQYNLAVWHGFTLPLLMSVAALLGGALIYRLLREHLLGGVEGPPLWRHLKSQHIFERVLVTVSWRWAGALKNLLGTRHLQVQLRLLVGTALIAALWSLYGRELAVDHTASPALDPAFALLWTVGATCAVGAACLAKYHRLAALILVGGAGLVTSITFVWLSAPDLALTQLLVEIVTTVLILLGLRWLPKRIEGIDSGARLRIRARRLGDLALALVAGSGLSLLAYAVMSRPAPSSISRFFLEHAYTEGGGTNVVNVILVDFRGFDTLGEITVLGIVALAVYALLRRFRPASDSIDIPEQQRLQNARDAAPPLRPPGTTLTDYLAIPAVIMQLMFPFIGVLAMFLLIRGHNLPGGGFIAGITMTVGLLLLYIAGGIRWVEARLHVRPVRWIAMGLLLAAGTGVGAWLFSYPFLTSYAAHAELPVIGRAPLASALLFDLGVFVLVVGAMALILLALAHQSIRSHRTPSAKATVTPPSAGET
ncbi:monovalent cation/H+ antiporter subunit A [Nitrococcus mobilis]|uniref:pH adaptation potassium efflux system component phaA and phaB n=1 Tax=Nitrococcus mobilis Nb-231 TaxID=314278 RepID=A4BLD4_9GAMM|nr:monovalent cation/H+ antiporter subunit A [Nitrococcus mobilis]EAR23122.1 pH adaptation potassium efflux system component phaA and phaB [Nitrococcus mobilis Nb-231]